jgi:TRAP-type C4-dicarboxylate transport system substrate-binding protein
MVIAVTARTAQPAATRSNGEADMTLHGNRGLKAASVALGLATSMSLAACAQGGASGASGGGEGVPYGASKAEYKKAFADVQPIELETQTPAPKGSVTGKNMEEYFRAVTAWSGGKITWQIAYSSAIAGPTEEDDALVDGRLDLSSVLPIYEPSEYPANAALIEAGFISDQTPVVGALQSNAWPNQVAFQTPDIEAEYEDHGMKVLMPIYNSGANVLFCSEPRTSLSAIDGAEVASGGEAQSAEIEALGGSAATVEYTELFESLERGVVDCSVSSPTVGVLGGFIPAAPHITVDANAGFALAPGAIAMSKSTWDSLPLVAQQLLWDRLDVFMASNIEDKIWPNYVDAVNQALKAGGEVNTFAPDAARAINQANADMLADIRKTDAVADGNKLVDDSTAAAEEWKKSIEGLGYSGTADYEEFASSYEPGKISLDAYVKQVYKEIFLPQRPS